MVEVKTRASEAKGHFPGGKRVGSWGKKKKVIEKQEAHPAKWTGLRALIQKKVAKARGLIIQACIIFGFKSFFMAIEAELCGFELAYDIDLGFFWNFAFHI